MKKLGLLMAMALTVTVGGVYATWTYTQNTDVADETVNTAMNLTGVAYSGSYGTYAIDRSTLELKIDPMEGTTHTTALLIKGQIVITFTPNSVAPQEVKNEGVPTTIQFGLSNTNWTFDDDTTDAVAARNIITLTHGGEKENIAWGEPDKTTGVFTYTITAEELAKHLSLTEFNLDTKAKYDAYSTALSLGNITLTVSDGITSSTPSQTPENPEKQ